MSAWFRCAAASEPIPWIVVGAKIQGLRDQDGESQFQGGRLVLFLCCNVKTQMAAELFKLIQTVTG